MGIFYNSTNNIMVKDNYVPPIVTIDIDNSDSVNKVQMAKSYMKQHDIIIIIPCGSIKELNNQMDKWNQMTSNQKDDSDNFCIEIFDMNNQDHYDYIYAQIMDNNNDNIPPITSTNGAISNITINNEYTLKEIFANMKNKKSVKVNNINTIFENYNNLPLFTPTEMVEKGVFVNYKNYYGTFADNFKLSDKITVKEWFEYYSLKSKGILTENDNLMTTLWIDKLNELYSDFDYIKKSGDEKKINARKQSILELGWNPEIQFNIKTRERATQLTKNKLNIQNCKIVDLSEMTTSVDDIDYVTESTEDKNKYPVYLVLVYTASTVGKAINRYTNSIYSHAAIALDSSLDRLYSFNMKLFNKGGFTIESVGQYVKDNINADMAVYTVFLNKKQYEKITNKIQYFIDNVKNTGYSFLNIFGIMLNKPIHRDNDMVCSQFVDTMLKIGEKDITDKDSSLVTPKDLYTKANEKKIYKIFEGKAKDYLNARKNIDKILKSMNSKIKTIKENSTHVENESQFIDLLIENYNDINTLIALEEGKFLLSDTNRIIFENYVTPFLNLEYLSETKEFPIQFDKEGNLLISKNKNINFDKEYAQSHKLLKVYKENGNLEGIKYEVAKLWYLNSLLENIIYDKSKKHGSMNDIHKSRARILNDFNKYIKYISSKDKEYNFTTYYNNTPFSDATVKINNSTLKYGKGIIKGISKIFL